MSDVEYRSALRIEDVRQCTLCPELGSKHAAAVGPQAARIMIVMDHPSSREEEANGQIMASAIGHLWDYVANQMIVDRNEWYFTALVKCRPSGEGIPDGAVTKCMETWFLREMAIVQPEVVICCGKRVWETLVPEAQEHVEEGKSSYIHGARFPKDGRQYIACWHPRLFDSLDDIANLAPFVTLAAKIEEALGVM